MSEQEIILAIKIYMIAKCLKRMDMAKELKCSAAHLSGVLRGHKKPTKKILNYFGISRKTVFEVNNKEFSAFCFLAKDQIKKQGARA